MTARAEVTATHLHAHPNVREDAAAALGPGGERAGRRADDLERVARGRREVGQRGGVGEGVSVAEVDALELVEPAHRRGQRRRPPHRRHFYAPRIE